MLKFTSTLVLQTTACSASSTGWGSVGLHESGCSTGWGGVTFSATSNANFRETGGGSENPYGWFMSIYCYRGISWKYDEHVEGC